MNNTIEVLSALMGTGKTTGTIQWMNSNPQNKYLVVSPMLSEVEERIPNGCSSLDMTYPVNTSGTKSTNLLELLKEGRNICITHKLFTELRKEHLKEIKDKGYILVVDEEINFISPFTEYSRSDLKSLVEHNHMRVDFDDLGRVHWLWEFEEGHKYSKLKHLCDIGAVYVTKSDLCAFLLHLPIDLITSSKRVILLTYGYEGSIMQKFMQLKGIQSIPFTECKLMKDELEVKRNIKNLLKIVSIPSVDSIRKWNLSSTWYDTCSLDRKKKLQNVLINFKAFTKVSSEEFMFCTKKSFTDKMKTKKFSVQTSFVPANAKGTNDYKHKKVLIHAYNRYPNVAIKTYLYDYGYCCDDDNYALHELLQWIWRSAIRDDKEITLCICSDRMKNLLENWLENL